MRGALGLCFFSKINGFILIGRAVFNLLQKMALGVLTNFEAFAKIILKYIPNCRDCFNTLKNIFYQSIKSHKNICRQ